MNQERKLKLIESLKKERAVFAYRKQDTTEHDIVISFLENGNTKENPEKYELLDAAMNDFELLCTDYNA